MSQKRQYAAHFEYPDKTIKELGIVREWVDLLEGKYHSPSCGPHPNYAPDCVVFDAKGKLLAVEVCELVDRETIEKNIAGKPILRKYKRLDFLRSVKAILRYKDSKNYHGRYARIIVLIHTDEPDLSYERCRRWLGGYTFFKFSKIEEAHLFFSYSPALKKYQSIKINLCKTTFRGRVLAVVQRIPKGKTLTYREVAARAGSPKAYRAVGNILHTNFDPRIPCHRVVRSDGQTGGWNRGAERKASILKQEKAGKE